MDFRPLKKSDAKLVKDYGAIQIWYDPTKRESVLAKDKNGNRIPDGYGGWCVTGESIYVPDPFPYSVHYISGDHVPFYEFMFMNSYETMEKAVASVEGEQSNYFLPKRENWAMLTQREAESRTYWQKRAEELQQKAANETPQQRAKRERDLNYANCYSCGCEFRVDSNGTSMNPPYCGC